ncbi:MAG: hypothetical protein RLZZ299_1524 [Pseudomonadota bacterium]
MSSTARRARLVAWWRALRDPAVPWRRRAPVWLALAYVISPFDFIPEALLAWVGLGDDVTVGLFLVRSLWTLPEARHLDVDPPDAPVTPSR